MQLGLNLGPLETWKQSLGLPPTKLSQDLPIFKNQRVHSIVKKKADNEDHT